MDDAYDTNGTWLNPVNTDGTDNPDYTDLDADNDGDTDALEAWDTNNDGTAETLPGGNDADNDGLDDAYDKDDTQINPTNGMTPFSFPNLDGGTIERDWREIKIDIDGDGIEDTLDLDDDNDGITDLEEGCGNLVKNGDFEDQNFFDSNIFHDIWAGHGAFIGEDYNDDQVTSWTYTQNIDGWRDESPEMATAAYGHQYIDIIGNNVVQSGTLPGNNEWTQVINTEPGKTYTFSFYYGEDIGHDPGETVTILAAIIDDANNRLIDETLTWTAMGPVDGVRGPNIWYHYSGTFTATSAQTTVWFSAVPPGNGDTSAGGVIDFVSVTANTCDDFDADGIPNSNDLDSDNDGIYDIVEELHAYLDHDHDGRADNINFGNNGLANLLETDDTSSADMNYSLSNTDNTGEANYLDIDADDDGIVDNIEGQSTFDYQPPTGNDVDQNGVDDQYDTNGTWIDPIDTDGGGKPDYRDLTSDDDPDDDRIEGWDTNNDGIPETVFSGNDTDGDGLDDAYDVDDNNPDPTNGGQTPLDFPDLDNPGGDRDWREVRKDADDDGVGDNVDLDDDNDGIPDVIEFQGNAPCVHGFFQSKMTENNFTRLYILDTDSHTYFPIGPETSTVYNALALDGSTGQLYAVVRDDNTTDSYGNALNAGDILIIDRINGKIKKIHDYITNIKATAGDIYNGKFYFIDKNNETIIHVFNVNTRNFENDITLNSTFSASDIVLKPNANGELIAYGMNYDKNTNIHTLSKANLVTLNVDNSDTVNLDPDDTKASGAMVLTENATQLYIINNKVGNVYRLENFETDANAVKLFETGNARANDGAACQNSNLTAADTDGDGLPDYLDLDADNDGIYDIVETGNMNNDTNHDGMTDNPVGDNGLDNNLESDDTLDAQINYQILNTDNNGSPNYIDIDSDDDGIVDNIEGQTTSNYTAPSGSDTDNNGVDDAYDTNGTWINPTNTDNTDLPDYIDFNSDNDTDTDALEGWDTDNDGTAETIPSGNDADNDGLDDAYDNDDTQINPTNGQTPLSFPDLDNPGGDRDWREALDTDHDGIADNEDIDDDNDGITDEEEGGCIKPLAFDFSNDNQAWIMTTPTVTKQAYHSTSSTTNTGCTSRTSLIDEPVGNYIIMDDEDTGTTYFESPSGLNANLADLINKGKFSFYWINGNADGTAHKQISNPKLLKVLLQNSTGTEIKAYFDVTGNVNTGHWTKFSFDLDDDTWSGNSSDLVAVLSDLDKIKIEVESLAGYNQGASNADCSNYEYFGLDEVQFCWSEDTDQDGIYDYLDLDSDNDGIYDIVEAGNAANDTDHDGRTDNAVGNNGLDNNLETDDTSTATINYTLPNTDGTGNPDYIDIDADDDGIVDNIEGQTTSGYTAPSGNDSDNNGVDDAYDTNGNWIDPTNTDGTDNPDYTDTNSDNDADSDALEGWDTNNDGTADTVPSGNDADNDGLDDAYDNDDTQINPTNGQTPMDFPNLDNPSTTERDWREKLDVVVSVTNPTVIEGNTLVFTISLSNPSGTNTVIEVSTANNTAVAPNDYTAYSGTISIPAGSTSYDVNISTIDDAIDEDTETMLLNLNVTSANTNNTGVTGTGTIQDNDDPGIVSVGDASATEGDDLVHTVTVVESVSDQTYTFTQTDVTTSSSDYTTPPIFSNGVTYDSANGTITVPAGVSSFTVTYPTIDDNIDESDETYKLTIGGQSGTGTIIDNDSPAVLSVGNASAEEGEDLVHTVKVTESVFDQTYTFVQTDNTATSGIDYTTPPGFSNGVVYDSTAGTIRVPAGVTSFTVTYPTIDDSIDEPDETYTLTIGGQTGTGTIIDNDNDPAVSFTKTDQFEDVDNNGMQNAGDIIHYTFIITNTGNADLVNFNWSDDLLGIANETLNFSVLHPGESQEITKDYIITLTDMNNGQVSNQAIVNAETNNGLNVSQVSDDPDTAPDDDPTVTVLNGLSAISVEKTGQLEDLNANGMIEPGESVIYTIVIVNQGTQSVRNLDFNDEGVEIINGLPIPDLDPGESASVQVRKTISQTDLDNGFIENQALIKYQNDQGEEFTNASDDPSSVNDPEINDGDDTDPLNDDDDVTVIDLEQIPKMEVYKTGEIIDSNGNGLIEAGEKILYKITIINTGNVSLTEVKITDALLGINDQPVNNGILISGETVNLELEYTIQQEDFDDACGTITNQALVSYMDPQGNSWSNLSDDPGNNEDLDSLNDNDPDNDPDDPTLIQLKSASSVGLLEISEINGGQCAQIGDVINYTFEVYNLGNTSLKEIVLNDDFLNSNGIEIAFVSGDDNANNLLDPAEIWYYTASYTINQEDIDNGEIVTQAVITATDICGNAVRDLSHPQDNTADGSTIQLINQCSDIQLLKTGEFVDENANGLADIGESIVYNFVITNTGNTTLKNINLSDPIVDISGGTITTLLPGESDNQNFTAIHVITREDIENGQVVNSARVTAFNPQNVLIEDISDDPNALINYGEDDPTIVYINGISIPEIFTPNGDGINDTFYISGLNNFENPKIKIYNRWGNLVYESDLYQNNWRGISEGSRTINEEKELPAGTYFYILKLSENYRTITGWIFLQR